jgi:putative nucleotidyltransferase with HDIG domain
MMPLVKSIAASVRRNPYALTSVARLKHHDGYTYMHSVAVCALMTALARELELDEPDVLEAGVAGLLHDLGKALTPLAALNKPGKRTVEEYEVAKRHSCDGWQMLQSADVSVGVLEVARTTTKRSMAAGIRMGSRTRPFPSWPGWAQFATCTTPSHPSVHTNHPGIRLRRFAAWRRGMGSSTRAFSRPL